MKLPTTAERTADLSKYDTHPWVLKRRDWSADEGTLHIQTYLDKIQNAKSILDLGTMNGAFVRNYLRPKFPHASITGVDLMPGALEYAKSKGGAKYLSVDLDRPMPFQNAAFDLVVGTEVLEHLYRPDMCLHELRRVLRPGGHIVFTMPLGHNADEGDHHTFLSASEWLAKIGRYLSIQAHALISDDKRIAVFAARRGHDMRVAFALYSFNRPHYLKRCLDAIDAAGDKTGIDFYHFQDGDQCFLTKKSHKSKDAVCKSAALAKAAATDFTVVEAPYNYGVAIQQMKSTELLFDQKQYDVLIGLVDDYVVSKNFFTITKALIDQFYWCPRVFSVIHTCYVRKPREFKEHRLYKYMTTKMMTSPGGWSIYRDRWPAIKERYHAYYEVIRTMSYMSRDHRKIYKMFQRSATSHDMGFEWAIDKTNLFNILPCVNRVIDIGVTGMHKRPHIHQGPLSELRLDEFESDAQPETFTPAAGGFLPGIELHEVQKDV